MIEENKNLDCLKESFLLTNGFIKAEGKFGEYFQHEKYQLFRCWFYDGKLQVGKKDVEKDICVWIASLENKNDFTELFRILTKSNIYDSGKNDLESNGFSFEVGV